MGASAAQAVVSLATSTYAATQQKKQADKAVDATAAYRKQVSAEQTNIQREKVAGQAAQAATERRTQIREERIRRSKILQSSANSGVTNSSGELGSVGKLSTQLGSNIGENLGAIQRGSNISAFDQAAMNIEDQTQNHINKANQFGQIGNIAQNIFQMSGGFKPILDAFSSTQDAAPVSNAVFKPSKQGK